jgi:hypothetical protein
MKAGSILGLASAMLLTGVSLCAAQQAAPPPVAPRPPAALSVPNPFAGLTPGPRDLYRSPDGSDRFHHLAQYPAPQPSVPGFFVPGVHFPGPYLPGYSYYYPSHDISLADTYKMVMADTYVRRYREGARGGLVLENMPAGAQVFVDGNYVGMAGEFTASGSPIDLTPGAHQIEVRAAGFDALTFSVMVGANSIVRYRGDMQPQSGKPAASQPSPSAPAAAKSFYVIPNCYAGDKPPTGTLPKGCDRKNLQTRK